MRRLAHIAYLAAALCFALTFFDIVYQGESLIHFTGQELVTGTTFHRAFQIGPATVEIGHVPALSAAYVALAALASAAGFFWMKRRAGSGIAFGLGAVAKLALLWVPFQVLSEIGPRFPGTEMRHASGYVCSLALTWLGIALSGMALFRKVKKSAP